MILSEGTKRVVALNNNQGPLLPPYYHQAKTPGPDAKDAALLNDESAPTPSHIEDTVTSAAAGNTAPPTVPPNVSGAQLAMADWDALAALRLLIGKLVATLANGLQLNVKLPKAEIDLSEAPNGATALVASLPVLVVGADGDDASIQPGKPAPIAAPTARPAMTVMAGFAALPVMLGKLISMLGQGSSPSSSQGTALSALPPNAAFNTAAAPEAAVAPGGSIVAAPTLIAVPPTQVAANSDDGLPRPANVGDTVTQATRGRSARSPAPTIVHGTRPAAINREGFPGLPMVLGKIISLLGKALPQELPQSSPGSLPGSPPSGPLPPEAGIAAAETPSKAVAAPDGHNSTTAPLATPAPALAANNIGDAAPATVTKENTTPPDAPTAPSQSTAPEARHELINREDFAASPMMPGKTVAMLEQASQSGPSPQKARISARDTPDFLAPPDMTRNAVAFPIAAPPTLTPSHYDEDEAGDEEARDEGGHGHGVNDGDGDDNVDDDGQEGGDNSDDEGDTGTEGGKKDDGSEATLSPKDITLDIMA